MFNSTCLYDVPLIQFRDEFNGVPEHFIEMFSSQFWYHMESDFINKIVAMRVYPYQNCIAFKFQPLNSDDFVSVILKEPELRILKRIWDCNSLDFNYAIKYYLIYSSSACQQWMCRAKHSKNCLDWYLDTTTNGKNE